MNRTVVALVVMLALGMSPWLIGTVYVNSAGVVVEGRVIEKREAILLPGGDAWAHIFEISYQYQPLDSAYPETGSHRVDSSLYRRLQVGSTVRVRYSPSKLLRPMVGVGSFLADTSPLSRLRYRSGSVSMPAELAGVFVAVLVTLVAYWRKSRSLGFVAALVGGVSVPSLLLAGFALLAFPLLFRAWRANPGKGYGWLLLGSMALMPVILYWRLPQPTPMPPSPFRHTTAIVRRIKVADQIWTIAGYYAAGEPIRQPFQMVDLEFTPQGARESIHVLDRVDLNSVPGLRGAPRSQSITHRSIQASRVLPAAPATIRNKLGFTC